MNPVIQRELDKIRAPLPDITDDVKVIKINKYTPSNVPTIQAGKSYLIGLPDYILVEPPNYNLSANWNRGIVPQSNCLKVTVIQVFGPMMQINGRGFDYLTKEWNADFYDGLWLPIESVTIIQEL